MDTVTYLWEAPGTPRAFSTAVSLHSHTLCSRESLDFIPALAAKNSLLNWGLDLQKRRCKKIRADFNTAYWTPPLSPQAAYRLERSQIEDELNLAGIVSLSDHDNIEAPLEVRASGTDAPISTEWTVPLPGVDFHVGVHNLPVDKAKTLAAEMNSYTQKPREERLMELFQALEEIPEVLMVLNHPMWDISAAGPAFLDLLNGFLRKYGNFMHACELNGLRSHKENEATIEFARAWNKPLISGGDRHGCEANAVLNLTRATSMSEFVDEVRKDAHSHLLFMPCYREPLWLRTLQQVIDVVQDYPGHPLGTRWEDRVFHADREGNLRPLSQIWERPPQFIETTLSALRMVEENAVRWNSGLIRNRKHATKQLFLRPGGEAA